MVFIAGIVCLGGVVGSGHGIASTILLHSTTKQKRGNTHGTPTPLWRTRNARTKKHLDFAFEAFHAKLSGVGAVFCFQKLSV